MPSSGFTLSFLNTNNRAFTQPYPRHTHLLDFAGIQDEDCSGESVLHFACDVVHLKAMTGVWRAVHRHQEVDLVEGAEAMTREVKESVGARHFL